jgi:hypothetical protein
VSPSRGETFPRRQVGMRLTALPLTPLRFVQAPGHREIISEEINVNNCGGS